MSFAARRRSLRVLATVLHVFVKQLKGWER
jgi:hypothetical protein